MKNYPKRDDKIYLEIESFEEYELTQCVAYEMAIRNKDNLKAIDDVVAYYNQNKLDIHNYLSNKIYDIDEIPVFSAETYPAVYTSQLSFRIKKIDCIPFNKNHNEMEYRNTYFISEEFYQIVDLLIGKCKSDEFTKKQDYQRITLQEMELEEITEIKKRDGYLVTTKIKSTDKENKKVAKEFKEWIRSSHSLFGNAPNYSKLVGVETTQRIQTNFKRPLINIDEYKSKNAILELDLNRPLKEIIAYITHIKDDLKVNEEILKAPIELLSEELHRADNKYTQKNPFATKYADWFFIYDSYQVIKENSKESDERVFGEIDLELIEHYKSTEDNYYSIETYKKTIMKRMKYFIDNLGYKELITGTINKG